jgi:hypothetical protein
LVGYFLLLARDLKTAFWGVAFRYNGFFTYLAYSASAVACSVVKNEKYRKLLLSSFAVVSVALCLVMLGQNYGLKLVTSVNGSRNQSVFLNPNHFGYLLAMSIVLLGGATVLQSRILPAAAAGLLFLFEAWVLTLNDTFGAQVAVFLALLLMFPAYRHAGAAQAHSPVDFTARPFYGRIPADRLSRLGQARKRRGEPARGRQGHNRRSRVGRPGAIRKAGSSKRRQVQPLACRSRLSG